MSQTFDSKIKLVKATPDKVATLTYTIEQIVETHDAKTHDLYVRRAMKHILIARNALRQLHCQSNTQTMDLADGLQAALHMKIKGNRAYKEADEILRELREYIPLYQQDNQ